MEVVPFKCLRIQSELNRYIVSGSLTHDLMSGVYSIDDLERCYDHFTPEQQEASVKITKLFKIQASEELESLREVLRQDYTHTINSLRTNDYEFSFPTVLTNYRPDINPVTALYYECREAIRRFDPTSEKNAWLHQLVTNNDFNNQLQDALLHDISRLNRIINRYYWAFKNCGNTIPIDLLHAERLIKDFKHYTSFFQDAKNWKLDE